MLQTRASYNQESLLTQSSKSSSDLDSLLGGLDFGDMMKEMSMIEAEVNSTNLVDSRRSSCQFDTLHSQSSEGAYQTKVPQRNSGKFGSVNLTSQSQNGDIGSFSDDRRRNSARFDSLNTSSDRISALSSSDKPSVALPRPRSNPVVPQPQLPQPQPQQMRPQLPQPQLPQPQPQLPQPQPPQVRPQLPQPQPPQMRPQLPQPQPQQVRQQQVQPPQKPSLDNEELQAIVKKLDSLRKKSGNEFDSSCIQDLKFVLKSIQQNPAYCPMLLANNLLFILVSLVMLFFNHYDMSALVLKVVFLCSIHR